MGCNRTPTEREAEQIHEAASRVASATGGDLSRAEMYVSLYGEFVARCMLARENQDRYQAVAGFSASNSDNYSFERPAWESASTWGSAPAAPSWQPTSDWSTPSPPFSSFGNSSAQMPWSAPNHDSHSSPQPPASTPTSAFTPESTPTPRLTPTNIDQRTAPSDPNYWQGERFIDPRAWKHESALTIYRDQTTNSVLSVEGWIQPVAYPDGTGSLSQGTKDTIKGPFAEDPAVHLAHCFAKCFGGPLLGNLEPFEAAGNLSMSPLEKELRAIVDAGTPLFAQCVFHREHPSDPAPTRHEIAVFMLDRDGSPRQVGCFAVDARGVVNELPFNSRPGGGGNHVQ